MNIHLYLVCSRFEALIASHLPPEEFGLYMAVGTKKLASGRVVFFEIDPSFRSPELRMDDIEQRCVPHSDGSPKRSKYISVYRVMERVPLSAYGGLYLTTMDGRVLRLDDAPYDREHEIPGSSLYQELCPLIPMVASSLPPAQFASWMTEARNPVGAPRLFFVDLVVERDERGRLAGHLPYSDPLHIADCLRQLEQGLGKPTKTVSRTPRTQGIFRIIRRGFFLGDPTGLRHYPFPSREVLEIHHASWWHSASSQ